MSPRRLAEVRPSRRAVAKPSAASARSTRSRKLVNWLHTYKHTLGVSTFHVMYTHCGGGVRKAGATGDVFSAAGCAQLFAQLFAQPTRPPINQPEDDALDSTAAGPSRCRRSRGRRILAQPLQEGSHLGTCQPRCRACCTSSSRGTGASCAWAGGGAALGACRLWLLLLLRHLHQATLCWQTGLGQGTQHEVQG